MDLTFSHRYEPGASTESPTLLLLHGTGGDENDLIGVGQSIAPRANLLSPRGKVMEGGAPRYFRRFAEGIFDEDDLKFRAGELAEFISGAADAYSFDRTSVVAVGYSNGANIAGAMLLLSSYPFAGAILIRPMVPLMPDRFPRLEGRPILIESGSMNPMGAVSEIERLVVLLGKTGAELTIKQHHAGHGMTHDDFSEAQRWLGEHFPNTQ